MVNRPSLTIADRELSHHALGVVKRAILFPKVTLLDYLLGSEVRRGRFKPPILRGLTRCIYLPIWQVA